MLGHPTMVAVPDPDWKVLYLALKSRVEIVQSSVAGDSTYMNLRNDSEGFKRYLYRNAAEKVIQLLLEDQMFTFSETEENSDEFCPQVIVRAQLTVVKPATKEADFEKELRIARMQGKMAAIRIIRELYMTHSISEIIDTLERSVI